MTAGLCEYARRIIEGEASLNNTADLYNAFEEFTPGAKWNGNFYWDGVTGEKSKNHLLVYMDMYIFGKGYLPSASQEVPKKYDSIRFMER